MLNFRIFVLGFLSFGTILFDSCQTSDKQLPSDFPKVAQTVDFEQGKAGSAVVRKTIEFLDGDQIPFSQVQHLTFDEQSIYLQTKEGQAGVIHVLDRYSHAYKGRIGSSVKGDPNAVLFPFSILPWKNQVLVSENQGMPQFYLFDRQGQKNKTYEMEVSEFQMPNVHFHNVLLKDSTILISKSLSQNGKKAQRLVMRGDRIMQMEDWIDMEELHAPIDSLDSKVLISRLFMFPSYVQDTAFFAIPNNKYLINRYSFKTGNLIESVSLTSIPILHNWYGNKAVPFNLESVAMDQNEHFYFPTVEVIDQRLFESGVLNDLSVRSYIVKVDLRKKQYQLYSLEDVGYVLPIQIIDHQLWCYDQELSQLKVVELVD